MAAPDCALCKLEITTKVYYENDTIIILDCRTCGPDVPMGILKRHTMDPTLVEAQYLSKKLKELFSNRRLDTHQRSIPNHLHWHMRGRK